MTEPRLDRIRGASNHVDGNQAYIRDTGLTVSQIVREIMQGKTVGELLTEYNALDSEDVEQALVYALRDTFLGISLYRNEGLGPLTAIRGYAEVLRLPDRTEEERREFLKIIYQQSETAIEKWNELSNWVNITYRGQ